MIRAAALLVLLMAGRAGAVTFDCGLTEAPAGKGLAGPLVIKIDESRGRATVADPMTRFYAGGPVAATAKRIAGGWHLEWSLRGVQGTGTAPADVAYVAEIADGKLRLTAGRAGAPEPAQASGMCWPRGTK